MGIYKDPYVILRRAADFLEKTGTWAQGEEDGVLWHGTHCAATAIAAVSNDGNYSLQAENLFRQYIGKDYLGGIIDWNDAPGQTAENVINTLRSAGLARTSK